MVEAQDFNNSFMEKCELYLDSTVVINWVEIKRRDLTEEQLKAMEEDRMFNEEVERLQYSVGLNVRTLCLPDTSRVADLKSVSNQ